MRIHYLQHVACEDPLEIAAWAHARGHGMTGTRVDRLEPLPALDAFDALVVMGGPMNVHEEDRHPWLRAEKSLVRDAVAAGRQVLGVCLGAQLLADALGAPVTRNPVAEIGWWEVTLTPEAARTPVFAGLPGSFTPMHWHGDTFAIPPGCIHAARSAACANQAFVSADGRFLGLQFHLEENEQGVALLLDNWADEIVDAPFIQPAGSIRAEAPARVAETQPVMTRLLDNWAAAAAH